jgi:penicillin-binding protein 1A
MRVLLALIGILRRARESGPGDVRDALNAFIPGQSGLQPPPLPRPFHMFSPFGDAPGSIMDGPQMGSAQNAAPELRGGMLRRMFFRLSWKWRIIVGLPALAAMTALPCLAALMVYYTVSFPHPLAMRNKERAPVVRILARDGSVLAERGAAHDYMPLDLLPRHVTGAVVATEDRRFFEHYGLDPAGLGRAFFANLRAGRFAQGGSTLTQQLAKNLFLTPERTLSRKVEELALALWLELRLSKPDILELYLNRVYFGGGAYGIEAASQRYFDKSARELTLGEAALIAGLLKAPSKYSPAVSPGAARARGRVVLSKMVEAGIISRADEAKALAEHMVFAASKSQKDASGIEYAVDFVLERLPPLVGGGHAEVIVETTLDAALQRRANEIVAKSLARQGEALSVSQAAVVLLDNDGGIRALVGGRNYAESQFNRAVKARRQPGSAFKPFVYLAAIESGLTPDSVTYDLPLAIDGWAPRNDNGQYVGEITLRRALAQSVNTVAVRLNQEAGRGRTISVARRLGIKSDLREEPSLPLGTSEVSLLELTGAYGVFGNGGTAIEPHAIRRVRMSSGRVLFAREATRTAQVVDPVHVGAMNDMLNAALVSGTGRRAAIPMHPAAGKTGTSQDFRDAWFVGYTAHLTAGVWIGNDSGKVMNKAVGGGLPAEIWREIMTIAHEGKAPLMLPGTESRPAKIPVVTVPPAGHIEGSAMSENLPWLSAAKPDNRNPQTVSPQGRIKVVPPAVAHPVEPIGEDFINQAIAGADVSPTDEMLAASAEKKPERPKGMMSLGGWW